MEERRVRITAGQVQVTALLNTSHTSDLVWEALPFEGTVNTWGDEIFFRIPVDANLEDAKEVVELGDVGYWPPGSALCLFFGPTPASRGDEIRPASPVNVIGQLEGETAVLKKVYVGVSVRVERA